MKQIFVRGDHVAVQQVAPPVVDARGILVESRAMAISIGTETHSLRRARRNLFTEIASAEFQDKVVARMRAGTLWSAVRRRFGLSAPTSPLHVSFGKPTGYSCAGRVLEVGEWVKDTEPGDRVACAGAPHADIVSVMQNLFVPIPESVGNVEASFVALGSIALHAVHQAQLTPGETVLVMGLGVIGQLVEQLVRVSGGRSVAMDLVEQRVELARRTGADLALHPSSCNINAEVLSFTSGLGADVVMLCMGGDSSEPMKQALDLVRDRGRIVIVGTPRIEVPRAPLYRKEIELRIARSYGPGRYDPAYEEEGHDYPVGYVRWTERRNMAEFLRLVAEKRVDVASLVTHHFPIDQAPQAYEVALGDPRTAVGIVLTTEEKSKRVVTLSAPVVPERQVRVAVLGAGSFARKYHLPNIRRIEGLGLYTILTGHRKSAEQAVHEFGAQVFTANLEKVLNDPAVELVLIATPHHLHAEQTVAALEAGKAVFCEKPMAMTRDELDYVIEAVERTGGFYSVGYNRRFAPTVLRAQELLAGRKGPLVLNYRVMGTFVPADHWIYDPARGGGRIIGEASHFFDLLYFLVGHPPLQVTAIGGTLSHPGTKLKDNIVCTLTFEDGSIASLVYGDLGQSQFPKERLEIFAGEGVLIIDDFIELVVQGFSGQQGMRLHQRDKGHYAELEILAQALLRDQPPPIDVWSARHGMLCAFTANDALDLKNGQVSEGQDTR